MKKLIRASILVLLVSLVLAVPVLAYTEVTGQVLDGETSSPWLYGGTVKIYKEDAPRTDITVGTCSISTVDGTFTCTYTQQVALTEIRVYVDPAAGSGGDPGPISSFFLDDGVNGTSTGIGYVYTNTGPNAVSLSSMNGFSALALALVLPLAVLGGVVYTKRKHQ